MGFRLADDFLAKQTAVSRCTDCRQMADVLSKQALPMYLGKKIFGREEVRLNPTAAYLSNRLITFKFYVNLNLAWYIDVNGYLNGNTSMAQWF